jgi:hypothetical protein
VSGPGFDGVGRSGPDRSHRPTRASLRVFVRGGLVQGAETPGGVRVVVDHDVDGAALDQVPNGEPCWRYTA